MCSCRRKWNKNIVWNHRSQPQVWFEHPEACVWDQYTLRQVMLILRWLHLEQDWQINSPGCCQALAKWSQHSFPLSQFIASESSQHFSKVISISVDKQIGSSLPFMIQRWSKMLSKVYFLPEVSAAKSQCACWKVTSFWPAKAIRLAIIDFTLKTDVENRVTQDRSAKGPVGPMTRIL